MSYLAPGTYVRLTNREDDKLVLTGRITEVSHDAPSGWGVGHNQFVVALDSGGELRVEGPANAELPWSIEKIDPPLALPTKHGAVIATSDSGFYSYYLHHGMGFAQWYKVGAVRAEQVTENEVLTVLRLPRYNIVFEGIERGA